MYTVLRSDPRTTAEDLVAAADDSQPIDIDDIYAWATDYFRDSHRFPTARSTTSVDLIAGANLIAKGQTVDGDSIELYQNGSTFHITLPDHNNRGYTNYIRHDDREFLEKYVRGTRCEFAWD